MTKSSDLLKRDKAAIAGATKVRYNPMVIERGEGNRLIDVDGRSYLDFAELLRARDGASSARVAMEHVEQAERLFAELGMLRHVRWAQTLATRLGEQPPKTVPTKSDDSSPLTRREREVLKAVSQGLTNQQVADLLIIQLPTVQRHVANIFNKLGVNTRTAAASYYFNQLDDR